MIKSASLADYLHFFRAGLTRHSQTGSFFPSSKVLVQAMIEPVPPDYRGSILELGAGTGVLTVPLASRCPRARIVACEINPTLAEDTRQNLARAGSDGRVQVRVSPAEQLLADLLTQAEERPGYVISGLPLGNWPGQRVLEVLQTIQRLMQAKGLFIQAQYLLLDRKHIRTVFGNVRTAPVLRNMPPIFVYFAQKTSM
jgi:phosphatidylethanolamine/phosphatidyl-N-methylethanolamine N-methyltransferase